MENIAEKINLIIGYLEEYVTDEIDQDKIAQIACCSYYDIGRIFSSIVGISMSDYLRKRRLTLAGVDLKYNDMKVVDVAQKYQYDSPVSFARAFQAFHGFNPNLAKKDENVLRVYPRLTCQINVRSVIDVIKKDIIEIEGKKYEASYFGERDMSSWSKAFSKRKYWRLENAYDDFKDRVKLRWLLPYNNYPPIDIEVGQIFLVDHYRYDGTVEHKYYISDGAVWNNMRCTTEFVLDYMKPIRSDKISIQGREYEASYFGEEDMWRWSDSFVTREFWRIENVGDEFDKCDRLPNVLPYNNYPPIDIKEGDVFAVDYHRKDDATTERLYFIADGTVWRDMPCTRQIVIEG